MYALIVFPILLGLLGVSSAVQAQSACSSDGQRPPAQVLERFINADCLVCWSQPPAEPPLPADTLALDWIVLGAQGDAGPLASAANSDAAARLAELGRALPGSMDSVNHAPIYSSPKQPRAASSALQGARLRVAHGLPLGGYIGVSIELLLPISGRGALSGRSNAVLRARLLLVETIPAGVDGTKITRNLVRNSITSLWDLREQLSITQRPAGDTRHLPGARFYTSQVLSIPEGT
ncbi:MAG: hypothetical protein ACKVOO_08980, partial [Burkholderiaceae bacterium]